MPLDPKDLSLDDWRPIGERFADEYAAADRADAPLFAKQQAEAAMREDGLLAPDQHLRWRDDGKLYVADDGDS